MTFTLIGVDGNSETPFSEAGSSHSENVMVIFISVGTDTDSAAGSIDFTVGPVLSSGPPVGDCWWAQWRRSRIIAKNVTGSVRLR